MQVFPMLTFLTAILRLGRIYQKMGLKGWEFLIPFCCGYVFFRTLYGNSITCLLIFIPVYNLYIAFKADIDLAYSFGKGTGFGLGLFFLPVIFEVILGFDNSDFIKDGWTQSALAF